MVGREPRVLVVDRRDEMASAITDALAQASCLASVTASLDEAIRAAKELRPEIALVHVAPGGRRGSLVAMTLGEEVPALRVLAYGSKVDTFWLEAAASLGLCCPVLEEERIREWIVLIVPKMARLVRLERSVRSRSRRFALGVRGTEQIVPVDLNAAVMDVEEAAIRAALSRANGRVRQAARLLSISDSSPRTKMAKHGIRG